MFKKMIRLGLLLALFLGMLGYALPASASTPQTYTVLVGAENTTNGASIMSFFPQNITIHVGDIVTWISNSHEPHTVTFPSGTTLGPLIIPAPAEFTSISPLQFNPAAIFPHVPTGGIYNGATYVNSGFMSTDPGRVQTFSLTFSHIGTYDYLCYIHGQMMMGSVTVVGSNATAQTPTQVLAQGQAELHADWLKVPTVLAKAYAQIVPPTKNLDGTLTHTVILDYESGNIGIMKFFPSHMTVNPGDKIIWKLSSTDEAPHTVTFFNGHPDQDLVLIVIGSTGPVALLNPAVLFPSQAVLQGKSLNNTDYFNSGLLMPGGHTSLTLKVGNISGTLNYECILHDTSGMHASLFVAPR